MNVWYSRDTALELNWLKTKTWAQPTMRCVLMSTFSLSISLFSLYVIEITKTETDQREYKKLNMRKWKKNEGIQLKILPSFFITFFIMSMARKVLLVFFFEKINLESVWTLIELEQYENSIDFSLFFFCSFVSNKSFQFPFFIEQTLCVINVDGKIKV